MNNTSQILQRNEDYFINNNIIICGYISDTYPLELAKRSKSIHIWFTDYSQFNTYIQALGLNVNNNESLKNLNSIVTINKGNIYLYFGASLINAEFNNKSLIKECTSGIVYITKSKEESKYMVEQLIASTSNNATLFAVGANDEGIKGFETQLKAITPCQKIDNARKCVLLGIENSDELSNIYEKKYSQYSFDIYKINMDTCSSENIKESDNTITINTLSGVFSAKKLDLGTKFLLETFKNELESKVFNSNEIKDVLDVGCGSGVISIYLSKLLPKAKIDASDINAFAISSLIKNNETNNTQVNGFVSDMFSNINKKYDLIISNPPFHQGAGIKQLLEPTKKMIKEASSHLTRNGSLLIVANSFLAYAEVLKESFKEVKVIAQNNKYKVYFASNKTN